MAIMYLFLYWRWLLPSHAGHHELPELELSRAWEPEVSSRAFQVSERKRSQPGFSDGNQKENSYMEKIRCCLRFDNMFVVLRRNLSGNLALFWMNDLDLHIRTFSLQHIDAVVNLRIDDAWRLTGFYGALEVVNREDSWSLLRHLSSQFVLPWVCIGDFNEITRLEEESGGTLRLDKQMQVFRDCLDFCGFKDIGFTGLPFTWCNNRFDGPLVWVRLDRAIASAD